MHPLGKQGACSTVFLIGKAMPVGRECPDRVQDRPEGRPRGFSTPSINSLYVVRVNMLDLCVAHMYEMQLLSVTVISFFCLIYQAIARD